MIFWKTIASLWRTAQNYSPAPAVAPPVTHKVVSQWKPVSHNGVITMHDQPNNWSNFHGTYPPLPKPVPPTPAPPLPRKTCEHCNAPLEIDEGLWTAPALLKDRRTPCCSKSPDGNHIPRKTCGYVISNKPGYAPCKRDANHSGPCAHDFAYGIEKQPKKQSRSALYHFVAAPRTTVLPQDDGISFEVFVEATRRRDAVAKFSRYFPEFVYTALVRAKS